MKTRSRLFDGWLALCLIAMCASIAHAQEPLIFPQQTLPPAGPDQVPVSGSALALDGNSALVLSRYARVDEYRRDKDGQWRWRAALPPPGSHPVIFDRGLALSGDIALVQGQVPHGPSNLYWRGIVHSYKREGGTWRYVDSVMATEISEFFDGFGIQLAMDERHAVVGAFLQNKAYVYRVHRSGHLTLETQLAPSSGTSVPGLFPRTVAVDGRTIMLAHFEPGQFGGAVHVYEKHRGVWSVRQILLSPTPAVLEAFGASIALQGNLAFIGAPGHDIHEETDEGNFVKGGAAYEFVRLGREWRFVRQLTSPDTFNGIYAGQMKLDGRRLLISDNGQSNEQNAYGERVWLYEWRPWRWRLTGKLVSSPERAGFGGVLALDRNIALISAPGAGPGAVYAFELPRLSHW